MPKPYCSEVNDRMIAEASSWIIDSDGLDIKQEATVINDGFLEVGDRFIELGKRGSSANASVLAAKGWCYEYLGRIDYNNCNLIVFTASDGVERVDEHLKLFCEPWGFKKPLSCICEVRERDFMYSTPSCSMRMVSADVVRC